MAHRLHTKCFFLLSIVGLLSSCSSHNEWEMFGLKGEVRTYFERSYDAEMVSGEWEPGELRSYGHSKASFDREGNFTWIKHLDDEEEVIGKVVPQRENGEIFEEEYYNEEGKRMSITEIDIISSSELSFTVYDDDGEKMNHGTSYFENGRVIRQEFQTYDDGEVEEELTLRNVYDSDMNLISQEQTDEDGEVVYSFRFEYLEFDEKGNWTKRLDFHSEDEPETLVTREYRYY